MSGINFDFYHSNLVRVNLALYLIEEHRRVDLAQVARSSGIRSEHRQWAAAHAERRRGPIEAAAVETA